MTQELRNLNQPAFGERGRWIQTTRTGIKRNGVIEMARKPLTAICRQLKPGSENKKCTELTKADYTPWEDMTQEEKDKQLRKMSERLSRDLSIVFRQHPEEWEKVLRWSQRDQKGTA